MNQGIRQGLSMEKYHADPAISKSVIHSFATAATPAHHKARQKKPKETKAMTFGEVSHMAILTPDLFKKKVEVIPDGVLATDGAKRGKAWKTYEAKCVERSVTPITRDDQKAIDYILEELFQRHYNRAAADLLIEGIPETSVFYDGDDNTANYPIKVRPDWLPGGQRDVDLKSTAVEGGADLWEFARTAARFNYHWSACLTNYVMQAVTGYEHTYHYIVYEQNEPYGVMLYQCPPEFERLAWLEMDLVIPALVECIKTDKWPIYPDLKAHLSLPGWKTKKLTEGMFWE